MIHGAFAVDSYRCNEVLHRVNTVSTRSSLPLFLKTHKAADFLEALEPEALCRQTCIKSGFFGVFEHSQKPTVGHAMIAVFNDSNSGSPHGLVGSNPTTSAKKDIFFLPRGGYIFFCCGKHGKMNLNSIVI